MSYALKSVIDRFAQRSRQTGAHAAASHAVVIRPAREADAPLLRDLAVLDSAEPLHGAVLVAVVDDRPWAAHGIDEDRGIADPFQPSAEAAGLLRLRARQLRSAGARARPRRRRAVRRAGAA